MQSQEVYAHVAAKVEAFLTLRVVAPLLNPTLLGPQLATAFGAAWEHAKNLAKCVSMGSSSYIYVCRLSLLVSFGVLPAICERGREGGEGREGGREGR
jgi:hypothetical protein